MGAARVGNKSICLPVLSETSYGTLVSNPTAFRHYLELWAAKHPEIFPAEMATGFWFHDMITSRKLNLKMRRIRLLKTGQVYQLRPEFVMPYMVGRCSTFMAPKTQPVCNCVRWLCSGIFTPTAAEPNSTRKLGLLPLKTSMDFSITTTGFTTC